MRENARFVFFGHGLDELYSRGVGSPQPFMCSIRAPLSLFARGWGGLGGVDSTLEESDHWSWPWSALCWQWTFLGTACRWLIAPGQRRGLDTWHKKRDISLLRSNYRADRQIDSVRMVGELLERLLILKSALGYDGRPHSAWLLQWRDSFDATQRLISVSFGAVSW